MKKICLGLFIFGSLLSSASEKISLISSPTELMNIVDEQGEIDPHCDISFSSSHPRLLFIYEKSEDKLLSKMAIDPYWGGDCKLTSKSTFSCGVGKLKHSGDGVGVANDFLCIREELSLTYDGSLAEIVYEKILYKAKMNRLDDEQNCNANAEHITLEEIAQNQDEKTQRRACLIY